MFDLKKILKDYFIDIDKAILKNTAKLYGDALVYTAAFIDWLDWLDRLDWLDWLFWLVWLD